MIESTSTADDGGGELPLFPEPQKKHITAPGARRVRPSGFFSGSPDAPIVDRWCRREGFEFGPGSDAMELVLTRRSDRSTRYLDDLGGLSDEKYLLNVTEDQAHLRAEITYAEPSGLRFALNTLAALHRSGGFLPCVIEDYPSFPVRGIIEGFYGPPWSDEERIETMRLIAAYKMNTYVYGPKDDPYHREKWAVRYDKGSLDRLAALFGAASDAGLTFCYSVGPGLSMRYSSNSDFQDLLTKLMQVYDLGVRSFALLLDDIPPELQFPEDKARFPELIDAQIQLVRRLHQSLMQTDPSIRLAVCPTEYHGRGDEYTVSRLGRSIQPSIDLLWTGPEICSRELTLRDAALFSQATSHPPLYWDNYPVNDLEMSSEMHIGPYRNRDRDLCRFSRGIIANGMEYPEASKIPFLTIACYAWNPGAYDPESCHQEAVRSVVGKRDAPDFSIFADNLRSSCLNRTESPRLDRILERFRFAFRYGDRESAFSDLRADLMPFVHSADRLSKGLENEKLFRELLPWLRKYDAGIRLLQNAATYLSGPKEADRRSLKAMYEEYMVDPTRVFADVLYPVIRAAANGEFSGDDR